jgi:hypothetical protein
MSSFTEGKLLFEFPTASSHEKFDDSSTHFLTHCMKAVDFIVELSDRIVFLEIKDPQHPDATLATTMKFERELRSGILVQEVLRPKCCDSLLYKLATQDIELHKPVYYYVLIALDTLSEPELATLTDELKTRLPVVQDGSRVREKFDAAGKPARFIQGCAIFNLATWNRMSARLTASVHRIP